MGTSRVARRRRRGALRRLGAEREGGVGRGRFRRLGGRRDGAARFDRRLGVPRARRREGPALQVRADGRAGQAAREDGPVRVPHGAAPEDRVSDLAARRTRVGRRGLDGRPARARRADADLRGAPRLLGGAIGRTATSRASSRTTSPRWASRTSSSCPSPNTRTTARGATRSAATTPRAGAGAPRRTSCSSSTRCTGAASACCSTGSRPTSRGTSTACSASTARTCSSTRTRGAATTRTGTPTSSTTAVPRSPTS